MEASVWIYGGQFGKRFAVVMRHLPPVQKLIHSRRILDIYKMSIGVVIVIIYFVQSSPLLHIPPPSSLSVALFAITSP